MKKILVADDDPAICDSLRFMLEEEGYEVSIASNGSVLKKTLSQKPDLLLLDLWMSGVDGRDVCKSLKQQKNLQHMPIILVSASRDIRKSAQDSGADDFIEKPFTMDDLLTKIQKWTSKK
ncbi:MAG TPA: response regulator [Candidatus Saccharimonadales bacterium]|nr:response regulator [Candidatus Saccharimonadales bacterium]